MNGLRESWKDPYSRPTGCIISLALVPVYLTGREFHPINNNICEYINLSILLVSLSVIKPMDTWVCSAYCHPYIYQLVLVLHISGARWRRHLHASATKQGTLLLLQTYASRPPPRLSAASLIVSSAILPCLHRCMCRRALQPTITL